MKTQPYPSNKRYSLKTLRYISKLYSAWRKFEDLTSFLCTLSTSQKNLYLFLLTMLCQKQSIINCG